MKFIFKLFGWLFSNLFLILVVVALCYAYVYWDDPFGKDTPIGKVMAEFPEEVSEAKTFIADVTGMQLDETKEVEQQTDSAGRNETLSASADNSAAPAPAAKQESTNDAEAKTGAADEPVAEAAASVEQQAEAAVTDASLSASTPSGDSDSSAAQTVAAEFAPAAEFPDKGVAPPVADEDENARAQKALVGDVFVPPEVEDALNQLHNDGSVEDVVVMQKADKPAEQLFIDARKAFYRRDYDASIAAYKQLIANNKDNFDAYGELGNVYFTKGDMELAAEAYYQAATIMVSQGQNQRAASLIGFLASVDAEKAKKLGEMLVSDEQQDAL